MTEVLVAALGTALALAGVISSIRSRPMSAGEVLEAAYAPRGSRLPSADPTPGPREGPARGHAGSRLVPRPDVAVARRVVAHLEHRSRVPADLATWCAAAGRSLDEVAARMVLGALCGVAVAFAIVAVAIPTGWPLPAEIPVWAGAALATAGALAPLVSLRAEARDSRRAARAAVSSFLDLVTLCLAGG